MEFRYKILDVNGIEHSGVIRAQSKGDAHDILSSGGDLIVSLEASETSPFLTFERRSPITHKRTADFARDLSGLLQAGAPLKNALEIVAGQTGKPGYLARQVLRHVEDGVQLSEALRKAGGEAVTLAEFAAAGEAGAGLDRLLSNAGDFLSSRAEAIEKTRNALAYPVFILVLAIAAISVLVIYVAPALAPALADSKQGGLILLLAGLGETIQGQQTNVLIGAGIVLIMCIILNRQHWFKATFAYIIWHLPYFGSIMRDFQTGQSAQVISALLSAGTSLEMALNFGARVSGDVLATHYRRIAERLRDGATAALAFETEAGLPSELVRLARLGEASSALPEAIGQAGQMCHSRAMDRIERFSAIAGPFLVIGIGGLIALLMLSVLSGLTSIGEDVL